MIFLCVVPIVLLYRCNIEGRYSVLFVIPDTIIRNKLNSDVSMYLDTKIKFVKSVKIKNGVIHDKV